jgi:hypothetical protein
MLRLKLTTKGLVPVDAQNRRRNLGESKSSKLTFANGGSGSIPPGRCPATDVGRLVGHDPSLVMLKSPTIGGRSRRIIGLWTMAERATDLELKRRTARHTGPQLAGSSSLPGRIIGLNRKHANG